jgi:gamma-aminobutyric acid receptor subunit beta
VHVGVSIYILSLHSFDHNAMEFTMEFYFRQYWNDPRLVFEKVGKQDTVQGNAKTSELIWTPDTFFVREKSSFIYAMTKTNEFIKIQNNGNVINSQRCV